MDISDFAEKWTVFTDAGRAETLSPDYFPNAKALEKEQVALKFPSDPRGAFPVADAEADSMKAQSFTSWLVGDSLPKAREASFATLTNLELAVWALPLNAFTLEVQRRNREIPSWKGLVAHAAIGGIKVHVEEPGPATRFIIQGTASDAPEPTQAWHGCRACVELPTIVRSHIDRWRVWLIAEYAEEIFVLDPAGTPGGAPTPTLLTPTTRILPRGWPLGIPDHFTVGRTFDTIVLTINLADQGEPVVQAIDQLERRLVDATEGPFTRTRHRNIRRALDDAAGLIAAHSIEKRLYRQPCRIVHRAG